MIKKILAVLLLACAPAAFGAVVLNETFSYSDGALTAVSGGVWANHSGTALQVDVASGKVNLTGAESEDVNATLTGQPYTTGVLYAGFTVNFSTLPSGTTTYFAHFKDTSTGFRCRIFSMTTGAAAGSYRLGITAAGTTPAPVPVDLSLNTDYRVVVKYSVADGASTIWVNPTTESQGGVAATDTTTALAITSFAFRQSTGIGAMTIDDLIVADAFDNVKAATGPTPTPPTISSQPQTQTVTAGANASIAVGASGSTPLAYQWFFNSVAISGATASPLVITNVQASNNGNYSVVITNLYGSVTSAVATLTVVPAVPPALTNIAALHNLIDGNYALTDKTNLYTVEGVVTTYTNLTTAANKLFYLQDDTGGIAVFWSGAGSQRLPAAGDKMRATGPLAQFNGLLELSPVSGNVNHPVTLISSNNLLPKAIELQFSSQNDPSIIEPLEGSYMVASNVFLDLTTPNFPSGVVVLITNANNETFQFFVNASTDIKNQSKPQGPVTIYGVLSQFKSGTPFIGGYELIASRYADIVSPYHPPLVTFENHLKLLRVGDLLTNVYTEFALRTGESIEIKATATPLTNEAITVTAPTAGLPAGAAWKIEPGNASQFGTFTYTASSNDLGKAFVVKLLAANASGTNTALWKIYVPTAVEQQMAITEFMAAPTTVATDPNFNPLKRATALTDPGSQDEYVELANLGPSSIDLQGWTISDTSALRHKFYDSFSLSSSNAAIVFGGPLNGNPPILDAGLAVIPASENVFGFGLNNTGGDSLVLRNGDGNLVSRVVFTEAVTASGIAAVRFPDVDGPFVRQSWVSGTNASPGRQYDGALFSQPTTSLFGISDIKASINASKAVVLSWPAVPNRPYSVWSGDAINTHFTGLAYGNRFTNTAGIYTDTTTTNLSARFYFITSP